MSGLDIVGSPANRPAGSSRRRRTRRRVRGCIPVLLALAVVVGGGSVAVWKGTDAVRSMLAGPEDYNGNGSGSVTIEVLEGDSAGDIGGTLERKGVVASVEAFTQEAATDSRSLGIQPGFYRLSRQMSARSALDRLVRDDARIENDVTVPEGLTVDEALRRLAGETRVPLSEYVAAARRPGELGLPAYAGGDPEGYLFPATYPLPPQVSAPEVLASMVERFMQVARQLDLAAGAARVGYTPAEVVTVASLVEAEARRPQDFRKVAAVIYNRLDEGRRLQLDSTVQYATGGDGVFTTDRQRRSPSAYNTYRVRGLPPGPVDAPGVRALRAALEPARADWTYFVTVDLDTGRTLFTDSYRRHLRNVEVLRTYCASSKAC